MLQYDPSLGIIATAMHLKNTVIPLVLAKAEFYVLLAMNLSVVILKQTGNFNPEAAHIDLSLKLTTVTGPLMTFFVVFYNGNVFARYQKLYELSKNMSENCLYIVSIVDKEVKNKEVLRKLTRWLLASTFIFFFQRVEGSDKPGHGLSASEWRQLTNLGLMTTEEVTFLKHHCDDLQKDSIPAFMLLHWSMRLYRQYSNRIPDLDKTYFMVRKCQEDVVEIMELPMPFQYFHIMNLMLMLNLALWSYSLALIDSVFAPLIFMFAQLMFQGLRELSVALSDPFGDDVTDFPLNEWMTSLYVRAQSVVEDTHDPTTYDEHEPPLVELKADEDIIDLLVDERRSKDFAKKSKIKGMKMKKASVAVKKAQDGKGDYVELSTRKSSKLKEDDEDDDEEEGGDE
eukprot:TRINITY_DN22925_c0_g2_i1.p1 TRINITY_DN22925_c0_g2~~TRINITY_DN22925_c0_g2_i1.p1  ORF type:complete len:398 (-),score=108.66 TRINITY_DN22925_c0_g2_i1:40-1233(-)